MRIVTGLFVLAIVPASGCTDSISGAWRIDRTDIVQGAGCPPYVPSELVVRLDTAMDPAVTAGGRQLEDSELTADHVFFQTEEMSPSAVFTVDYTLDLRDDQLVGTAIATGLAPNDTCQARMTATGTRTE